MKTAQERRLAACYQLNELAFLARSIASLADHAIGVIACGRMPVKDEIDILTTMPISLAIESARATVNELRDERTGNESGD